VKVSKKVGGTEVYRKNYQSRLRKGEREAARWEGRGYYPGTEGGWRETRSTIFMFLFYNQIGYISKGTGRREGKREKDSSRNRKGC